MKTAPGFSGLHILRAGILRAGVLQAGVRLGSTLLAGLLLAAVQAAAAGTTSAGNDPRLREIIYDPKAVATVPVKRGTVTLVLLDADESITELATGIGGDCAKPDSAWCIAAQPSGRTVFIKPKSTAATPNNLVIVTSRRVHNLRFQVLADDDPRPPVHRLIITAPSASGSTELRDASSEQPGGKPDEQRSRARHQARISSEQSLTLSSIEALLGVQLQAQRQAMNAPLASSGQRVSERLQAKPTVVNARYALAEGAHSQDIVPTLVFDDGRFTYVRFPGNREVPAVFQVLGDGSEALVNTRVEDDLLVVDRVSRRLVLRAGESVVGLWNEAFDIDGVAPDHGTTVPGVYRTLKTTPSIPSPRSAPTDHGVRHTPTPRPRPSEQGPAPLPQEVGGAP